MIPARYDAPSARAIFHDDYRYALWKEITDAYASAYANELDESQTWKDSVEMALDTTNPPSAAMVAEFELEHGHDVVAFLDAYCTKLPEEIRFLIHDGLTSSDLVDYALLKQLVEHATILDSQVSHMLHAFWRDNEQHIRPGRTHGQIADHTTWEYQLAVHFSVIERIQNDVMNCADHLAGIKSPGPTGWPGGFPEVHARGRWIADGRDAELISATQIIPRDRVLEWAAVYLRLACALENLAQLIRAGARADVSEVAEGAERVGSSSMPHKRNPIDSEKVCGLARVVRGQFLAIAENATTWDDRDISNSSVERMAVPTLAATVEHMIIVMTKVMSNIAIDEQWMEAHASDPRAHTNVWQVVTQRILRVSPIEASKLVREAIAAYPQAPGFWQTAVRDRIVALRGEEGAAAWTKEVLNILDRRFER